MLRHSVLRRDQSRYWTLNGRAKNFRREGSALISTLRNLCVLCASAVKERFTAEAQRTQRYAEVEPIMKRFPEHQLNAKIRRSRDVSALSRLAMLLFCGLVLAGGFVFAAKQHFAAVQFGYENETLRTERKRLIEENQRLARSRHCGSQSTTNLKGWESLLSQQSIF